MYIYPELIQQNISDPLIPYSIKWNDSVLNIGFGIRFQHGHLLDIDVISDLTPCQAVSFATVLKPMGAVRSTIWIVHKGAI